MDIVKSIVGNEITSIFDSVNFLILLFGIVTTFWTFTAIYKKLGREFIKVDFKISAFESDFWGKFFWYIRWAAVQQVLIGILTFWISNPFAQYGAACILFAVGYHFKNWRLVGFTFGFAVIFYGAWVFLGFQSLLYLSLLHAFGGTCYYKTGWDMRVWGRK
jgi:hypothetical protein